MNIKVFNLVSKTNETSHIEWPETCKCKCRLDASVCNNKQRQKSGKCRCECRELTDTVRSDHEFIWNLSICEFEFYKSRDVGEYLDYASCKCRKRLIDKLVEECNGDINMN